MLSLLSSRRKHKPHSSWLIAIFSAGILLGIVSTFIFGQIFTISQLILMGLVLLMLGFFSMKRFAILFVLIAGICFGLSRGTHVMLQLSDYRPYYGESVILKGKVSEDTAIGKGGDTRLQLVDVQILDKVEVSLAGKIWISTEAQANILRSDTVTVSGTLDEGFGNMSASMFRADIVHIERVVHADAGRELRDWFATGVRKAVPEPEASLGVGYLVGQRSTLPEDLNEQLCLLGLTHVVVASGYNLTILVRFARRAFEKVSKYLATVSAAGMITCFVLITGFSPSMSRAALVTGLSLAAWYFGRNIQPLVLLAFAAALTAVINPTFVWGDIGWYLSFASFAGIMILAPLLKHYFFGESKKMRGFSQIVMETMSAQLATLPIIAFVFGQYSLLALPANLLILPFIPVTMLLTFIAGLSGILLPGSASLLGWPAQLLLSYMTSVVDWMAKLPGASSELLFGVSMLILSYAVLVLVVFTLWCKTSHNFGRDNIVE